MINTKNGICINDSVHLVQVDRQVQRDSRLVCGHGILQRLISLLHLFQGCGLRHRCNGLSQRHGTFVIIGQSMAVIEGLSRLHSSL